MGRAKDQWLEEIERGWTSPGEKFVCCRCFNEPGIRAFIEDNAYETECTYCGETSDEPFAVHIDEVIEFISSRINTEWCDIQLTTAPYDNEEGSYLFVEPVDTLDLLQGAADINADNDELFDDIESAFGAREWVKREWSDLSPREALFSTWQQFCYRTKHQSRYFFMFFRADGAGTYGINDEDLSIEDLAERIGEVLKNHRMIRTLTTGTEIYRARVHKQEEECSTPSALGTIPMKLCTKSNRMSPSGIPMFYGAFDPLTAIEETSIWGKGELITIGRFRALEDLLVVDLTQLPHVPSIYEQDPSDERAMLGFLHDFVDDLTKPVKTDEEEDPEDAERQRERREHIEYVPTQILTEYFRSVFKLPGERRIMGLIYPSAVARNGSCCVLFVDNEGCGGESLIPNLARRFLALDSNATQTYSNPLPSADAQALAVEPKGQLPLDFRSDRD